MKKTLLTILLSKNMNTHSSNDKQTTGNYTEEGIRKMFNEIRTASYKDIFENTKLVFKDLMYAFGYSSPFSLSIFININEINKYNWPENAVRGLLAHELSHSVSYKRRSIFSRMLFIWNYPFSISGGNKVEKEADGIAIEKGYGKELIQERIYMFRIDDKKRVEKEKKLYLSVEALEKIIEEKKNA